jgi:hypothetical protein
LAPELGGVAIKFEWFGPWLVESQSVLFNSMLKNYSADETN